MYNVSSRVPTGSWRGFAAGYDVHLFSTDPLVPATQRRRALFGVTGSTQTIIPGSAGYQSEALGMSPYTTSAAGSGVIVGYDQDTTDNHSQHAFYYPQRAAGMVLLPEMDGYAQSQAIDVRVIGGKNIIGGFLAASGGREKAVLWDTTGIWTPNKTGIHVRSVMSLLIGAGQDVSEWTSLSRVTSISDDGRTIGGWGIWAADGSIRGFVATIPEPASFLLLSMGGLALLCRKRR
jgi:hypothetical protein